MLNSKKGFTLIEVSIVIALIGLVLLIIGGILNYNIVNFNRNSKYFGCKIDARYAMSKVLDEIRRNYDTYYDTGRVMASDDSVLVNSNANDFTGNIYYYREPDKYGAGDAYGELRAYGDKVLAENIKDFTIQSIDNHLIKITITSGRDSSRRIFEISTYLRLYE